MAKRTCDFVPYTERSPLCPVERVTPHDGLYIHRFFDTSPWSASGRFLVCLKLPFQDHEPGPEDYADVCVIDLVQQTIEPVYPTRGWGMQTGAHQAWGADDDMLYFNDKLDGLPVGVKLDLRTGKARMLEGTIYMLSPDCSQAISPCLIRTNHTQRGYGVSVAQERDVSQPQGASETDGIFRTNLDTGRQTLLLSLAEIFEALPDKDDYAGDTFYGFHVKYNPQGTRIMFVVRTIHPGKPMKKMLITCDADGKNVRVAVHWKVWNQGHHPNWHPDGERVLMNLDATGGGMRFYEARFDGANPRIIAPAIMGSGHPSWHSEGRFIVTDAYPNEPMARKGWVPIRLIDVAEQQEYNVCWIWTLGPNLGVLRCDPHPAWNRDFTKVCFTGAPEGVRQLFIADLAAFIDHRTAEK
ncbi:MAG TPA: hypothetical protein ENN09_02320 [Planctomycetes bacterium]|nr:hypothetical protein [Planctomycetota bacterium]